MVRVESYKLSVKIYPPVTVGYLFVVRADKL